MTTNHPNSAMPPASASSDADGKITITVTNNGSISPASYAAIEGWACAVVPVPGGTFVGSVRLMNGSTQIASWPVSTSNVYVVPAPPTAPLPTLCTLTTGATTGSNGTINIGSRPPGIDVITPLTEGASSPAPKPSGHPPDKRDAHPAP